MEEGERSKESTKRKKVETRGDRAEEEAGGGGGGGGGGT
jgi:hypothetical protein